MRICHFVSDSFGEYNSANWRGRIGANAINRTRKNLCVLLGIEDWMKDRVRSEVARADIIVVERVLVEESVDRAKYWSSLGKPIVIDIDDGYSLLQPQKESGNQAARFWKEGLVDVSIGGYKYEKRLEVTPLEQFRRGLKYCAGITMPSKILMEDWQMYAPCYYIPNYIDPERYLPHRQKLPHNSDEIIIGWGGSMSHKISFERSGVAEGLRRLFQEKKNVKFLLAGDNRILDILKLPPDRVIYQSYVNMYEWPRVLARMDLGIAPLQGRYDHSRSSLKAAEYSTMGIPFLATGCPTYSEWQGANIGWYVDDGPEDEKDKRAGIWFSRLRDMVNRYDTYKQLMDADFDYAQTWWVDNRVEDIVQTYQTIIDRFHGVT